MSSSFRLSEESPEPPKAVMLEVVSACISKGQSHFTHGVSVINAAFLLLANGVVGQIGFEPMLRLFVRWTLRH